MLLCGAKSGCPEKWRHKTAGASLRTRIYRALGSGFRPGIFVLVSGLGVCFGLGFAYMSFGTGLQRRTIGLLGPECKA